MGVFRKLRVTPQSARYYLFFAVLLIALPTLLSDLFPSHQGKILVASGAMNDTNFNKTIIYMTYHDFYGASGFVVNRPLKGKILEETRKRFPKMEKFYYGGPVLYPYSYYWLVPLPDMQHGFEIVSPEQLEQELPDQYNAIISNDDIAREVWVLHGYAAWGPMQLNREVFRSAAWDSIPFERELMFNTPDDEKWYRALDKVLDEKKAALDAI
ncbi:MAG: YqgE/AlgH family protein [Alphaproteobacteria bacterium]